MKIATKLKLAALIPALMAVIIGLSLVASYRVMRESEEKDRAAQRIISSMNELGTFVCEYVLYHEDRPLQQFLEEHDALTMMIIGTRFRDR